MVRPFRFEPSSLPVGDVERPRLLAALAQRWERRVVTVVAGPGFGKSRLLAAAVRDDARPAGATDVWLSCEPADADADHLLADLAESLGAPETSRVEGLCDRIWSEAPNAVCLVLDDVHEVVAGTPGAHVIERLVEELPRNGHLVLASRGSLPIRAARQAAAGELVRIREQDLVFTEDELTAFALGRGVDPSLLASTGGWPALAELVADAGADLVLEYLWEEVLGRLGHERARLLAGLALVGGADDTVAKALDPKATCAQDLVLGVPLAVAHGHAWVDLHPLWLPALRGLLSDEEATELRRKVAALHLAGGRVGLAAGLLAECGAWDELLALLRDVLVGRKILVRSGDPARWARLLPGEHHAEPAALLARGLALVAEDPQDAVEPLRAAALGFQRCGDVDGELTAISQEGIVRWWSGDIDALLLLHGRIEELAAEGSAAAAVLASVGLAGVAHLMGDSDGVLSHLEGADEVVAPAWLPTVRWLRSVAYRRRGDLPAARRALRQEPEDSSDAADDPQRQIALLRTDWLDGRVDEVRAGLPRFVAYYERSDANQLLASESRLELATKAAWLGDADAAVDLLPSDVGGLADHQLGRVLNAMAVAGVSIAHGDEEAAAAAVRDAAPDSLRGPQRWVWRDRLAIALTHVLVPETREVWAKDDLGPPHRFGIPLATCLEAARGGDLGPAAALDWPPPGVVRANLPAAWVAELAAAGVAAGNPPPDDLLHAVGPPLRSALREIASGHDGPVREAALRMLAVLPRTPSAHLRVEVIGPLTVRRDGVPVEHPELRRRRVRELLCELVRHRTVRREAIGDDLWPDLPDPGRNLRVTLSYLQQVLEPDRSGVEAPYFLRTEGSTLRLMGDPAHLSVDAWELDRHLDEAMVAEEAADPAAALEHYGLALSLWHGEPFEDAPTIAATLAERARMADRFVTAAVRAAELLLAAGRSSEAASAAERALIADPAAESAYELLARVHLMAGDRMAAQRTVDRCVAALAELGLEPDDSTVALLLPVGRAAAEPLAPLTSR